MADIFEQAREIRKVWSAYQSSRVLITANNYRVFDSLEKPKTAANLARELKTDQRATEIILDALTSIDLLKKKKDTYINSPVASRFLVSGAQYYQGDIIKHGDSMWQSWSNLDTVLKTGRPKRGVRNHRAFILGMHNLAALKAEATVRDMGLTGVKRALDLGGGPGTYAIAMARKGIHVTLFDAPETGKIAMSLIKKAGIPKGLIDIAGGDFFKDDIGDGFDLIFMSQILHSYSAKDNISLLKKCRKVLNKKGRVVIQEFLISEDRTRPVWSALFAINMLVNTEGGRTYTPGEMKDWLLKAGYRSVRKKIIADGVLVIAGK